MISYGFNWFLELVLAKPTENDTDNKILIVYMCFFTVHMHISLMFPKIKLQNNILVLIPGHLKLRACTSLHVGFQAPSFLGENKPKEYPQQQQLREKVTRSLSE